MSYVYDIVLNFNTDYFDFYEWKKDDLIFHIRKICLLRVDSKTYNEIFDNIVIFDEELLLSIFNKCDFYNNRKIDNIPYAFLLTDSYRAMGILLDNTGKVWKYSSLLLDEEEEILDLSHKLGEIKITTRIINKRNKNELLTRNEKSIIKYIKKDLAINYEKRNLNKLKYLYYEYFNKQCDDIDLIYKELMFELSKDIGEKHYDLYNLIKVTYSGKNV